jgi:hypothetical protein
MERAGGINDRMRKGVVRPFEATLVDFQLLHSALTEPHNSSGDFRLFFVMIALPDFPVAIISDIILLPIRSMAA